MSRLQGSIARNAGRDEPAEGQAAEAGAAAAPSGATFPQAGSITGASPKTSGRFKIGSPAPEAARPAPKAVRESDVASGLLNLEREARRAQSEAELGYLMVNGSRVAVPYRQAMLLLRKGRNSHRVIAVSSLSAIDRSSTFIRWIERLVGGKLQANDKARVLAFDCRSEGDGADLDASAYPFNEMLLVPLQMRNGTVFGHMLFSREAEWDEKAMVAAARLCEGYAHSWEALAGPARMKRRMKSRSLLMSVACAAIVIAGFIPVPLSVLAPAEIVARDPFVVAAPIDGTVATIATDPNSKVAEGDLLFTYEDTDLRNRLQLAGQAVSVAEARYQQSMRTSFSDSRAKRELAIAKSELQLKAGEYDYARELMEKTQVHAPKAGLVIFADKSSWTGRPVATGERIMRIADPSMVKLRIDLPVADAIVLREGAPVQLYLDSDPLTAVDATLTRSSFHAQPDGAGVLSYRVDARFKERDAPPRIGLRGTAKVFGEDVSLAYYIFRKPLAALRQWTGL